jgi:hypothetical protein
MTEPGSPRNAALGDERERVVQRLSDAFAADELALDQLESRMALVWRAESRADLDALVSDLPVPASVPQPTRASASVPATARDSKTLLAVMGGVARRGVWTVPASINAVAVMGGIEIDLREAVLTADVTEINVVAIMGGVQLIVPPSVRLDSDGLALLGGFEDNVTLPTVGADRAPTVRLRGFALMGGVEAKVLAPGVPAD